MYSMEEKTSFQGLRSWSKEWPHCSVPLCLQAEEENEMKKTQRCSLILEFSVGNTAETILIQFNSAVRTIDPRSLATPVTLEE